MDNFHKYFLLFILLFKKKKILNFVSFDLQAVDTFLDILMDEENFDDVNNIESWETVLKEVSI